MNGGFKTQPASAASSPSVSDAYAREQLILRAALVDDRAVRGVAEKPTVDHPSGHVPILAERENRHQRYAEVAQAAPAREMKRAIIGFPPPV